MTLLIDIGNTAIKWGFSHPKPITLLGRENYRDILPESLLLNAWKTLTPPKKVLISNVATQFVGEQINALVKKYWHIEAIFIQENQAVQGIKPLKTHSILGIDRWLGLLGLEQIEEKPFAMIGCGTATTLDICQNGKHLGGLIAPGVELMRLSLEKYTAGCRLNPYQKDSNDWLAFDTDGATRAGTLGMATTFIETTLEKIENMLDLELKRFITGGDATRLIPLFKHPAHFIESPALVLNGLVLFDR